MNKDELLKIYSACLPYGLQIQHKYEKAKHKGETVLRNWVKPLEPLDLGCLFPHRKDSFDWKPILWDLSYLTKPIEHEGERFVPIRKIYEINGWEWNDDEVNEIDEIIGICSDLYILSYDMAQLLLSWHFNIFSLPESEYINKATLTNK